MSAPSGVARRTTALHVLILLLAPALVFANTLRNGYHLDDFYRVVDNPELERVHPLGRHFTDPRTSATLPQLTQYRPLLPLSLSLTAAAGDALGLERLSAHHLGNLALHLGTCLLLYLLFRELLGGRAKAALGAALLFAVHPVSGVPVNYVCARDLLLMMFFLSAALLVYARMRLRGAGGDSLLGWVATLVLFALSLLAKTNSAVVCGVVFLFEYLLVGTRLRDRRLWARIAAVGAVAAAFFATTRLLGFSDYDQLRIERPWYEYPLTELRVHTLYYLRNFLWPFEMRPLPAIEPVGSAVGILLGFAVLSGSLALAFALRREKPVVSFCIGTYWILFALTSSVIPLRSFAADYRQYPSLAFLCLGLVALVPVLVERKLVIALALYLGICAHAINRTWRSEESLWAHSVAKGATAQAHMNYGRAISQRDPNLAEEHFQEALRLEPGHVYARINLGMLRLSRGLIQQGLGDVQRAAEMNPDWALTHHWLSKAQALVGNREAAVRASADAARLDPRNAEYQYLAAYDAQRAGDVAGSLPYLERLAELAPGYRDALFLEAFARQQTGRSDLAIDLYQRFLADRPEHSQARFNLGHARMERGDPRRAIEDFLLCLELDPSKTQAHYYLAECYERLGESDEAARHRARWEAARR